MFYFNVQRDKANSYIVKVINHNKSTETTCMAHKQKHTRSYEQVKEQMATEDPQPQQKPRQDLQDEQPPK
jgi:hypothetical protein